MAKAILVANWKNYPNSLPEAHTLIKELAKQKLLFKKLALYIAPPLTYLDLVAKSGKSFSQLATQDLSTLEKGTETGTVTSEILKSFGVRMSILGHSERRSQGESSAQVSEKIKMALRAGITPLVCVGEIVRDAEGEHFEFLRDQIKTTLGALNKKEVGKVVIAYEPVWAIGKSAKQAIDSVELSQTIIFIRKVLSDLFGRDLAESIPLLYGGSVEGANAKILMKETGVRGFLVGHESLKAKNFKEIALALTTK